MTTPKKWRNSDGSPKTCREEGCEGPVRVAGLCGPHYSRSRRKVDAPAPLNWYDLDGNRMTCLHLGCSDVIEARGLCSTHYRQALAGKPPAERRPRSKWFNPDGSRMSCQEEGCSTPIHSKGLCALHYDRAWKSSHIENTTWGTCPIPDCGRKKRGGALICGKCRQTRWRYGLSDESYLDMMQPVNRVCANPGCGATERLHLDHDHSCCPYGKFPTKTRVSCGACVRGWLCHPCNTSLGQMQESPERIRGLLTYLEGTRR